MPKVSGTFSFYERYAPTSARAALVILLLIYISSFVDRQIVGVLGTAIRDGLGLSNTQIGVLYGPVFSLIYAVCGLFMGWFADRFSRKYIILIGLVIWSLMTAASGFAPRLSFWLRHASLWESASRR